MWQIFRPRGFKEALLSSIYDAMYQLRPSRTIPLGIADRGMTDIRVCGQLRGVGRSVASATGRVGRQPAGRKYNACVSAAARAKVRRPASIHILQGPKHGDFSYSAHQDFLYQEIRRQTDCHHFRIDAVRNIKWNPACHAEKK